MSGWRTTDSIKIGIGRYRDRASTIYHFAADGARTDGDWHTMNAILTGQTKPRQCRAVSGSHSQHFRATAACC